MGAMRAGAAVFIVLVAGCGGAPGGGREVPTSTAPTSSVGPPGDTPAIRGPDGQIALTTMRGRPTTLAAHGARVTMVALWATWCLPCLEELPHIDALFRKYRGRSDISIIAVNVDETGDPDMRAEVARVVDELSLEMPSLLGGMQVFQRLTARDETGAPALALPLLAVVDAGFQIHRRFGFPRGISRAAYLADKEKLIEAALRGDQPVNPPLPGRR